MLVGGFAIQCNLPAPPDHAYTDGVLVGCGYRNRAMWTVSHSVGKLIEARLESTDSGVVSACLHAIANAVAEAPSPVVGLLDLSEVRVFGREDAELLVSIMRRDNPRVRRTAIVVSSDSLFAMQMHRLVRAAALPERQVFRTAAQALAWLTEVLSPEEAAHARAFMAG